MYGSAMGRQLTVDFSDVFSDQKQKPIIYLQLEDETYNQKKKGS